jgi:protein-tyrosine phosphatase
MIGHHRSFVLARRLSSGADQRRWITAIDPANGDRASVSLERMNRSLDWAGCVNVRDLGGLRIRDGQPIKWRSVVRSDNPAYLTPDGWRAAALYGVRTIIALRTLGFTDDEPIDRSVPSGITIERVYIEDATDAAFKTRCVDNDHWLTPLYFREMLDFWPERCAEAVSAVANAEPGGVVISCGRGCDRTGLLAFLLLGLVDAVTDDIVDDWELSVERLKSLDPNYESKLHEVLDRERTSAAQVIRETLGAVDLEERLLGSGLSTQDLRLVRGRLTR